MSVDNFLSRFQLQIPPTKRLLLKLCVGEPLDNLSTFRVQVSPTGHYREYTERTYVDYLRNIGAISGDTTDPYSVSMVLGRRSGKTALASLLLNYFSVIGADPVCVVARRAAYQSLYNTAVDIANFDTKDTPKSEMRIAVNDPHTLMSMHPGALILDEINPQQLDQVLPLLSSYRSQVISLCTSDPRRSLDLKRLHASADLRIQIPSWHLTEEVDALQYQHQNGASMFYYELGALI